MSEKTIMEELRSKLGDNREENEKFLREEIERRIQAADMEGMSAASKLLLEVMPQERREEIQRLSFVDGVRLDKLNEQINKLISEHNSVDAKPLAEKLYKKIVVEYAEGEKGKFVSLRNPFEDALCHYFYPTDKLLSRTPFDFGAYITNYAYILVETGSPLDAIPVLEKAMEYNPVDVGPKFELAEVYKLLQNRKKLFEVTRDTLKVASSPVAIARCYANVGYILIDIGEYEDAITFYTASAMFDPNPAIPQEIRHASDLMGKPAVRPSHEVIVETMKKYDIQFGPNQEVIAIAAQLAADFLEKQDMPNALNAMKITYNLTLDENIKNLILRYDPTAVRVNAQSSPEVDAVTGRGSKAPQNNN